MTTPRITKEGTASVWENERDVEHTVYTIREEMRKRDDLPPQMIGDIRDLIARSDPKLVKYFYAELGKTGSRAIGHFEERV
jgi:hypothetical protein